MTLLIYQPLINTGTDYGALAIRFNTAVTDKTFKYNATTDTWVDNALPVVPSPVTASSTNALVNNILYIVAPLQSVCHYIDMSLGVNGAWTAIPLPPFTINTVCSLTYDPFGNRLIAIDVNGRPHYLNLGTDSKPAVGARWDDIGLALVGTVEKVTPNTSFEITTKSQEVFAAQSDISFTITTYGNIVTSMSNVNTPNASFSFTSSAVGAVNEYVDNNILGTTQAIPFVIGVSASERASTNVFELNTKPLSLAIGSSSNGFVSGFGATRGITFKLTSSGSGIVSVVSVGDTVTSFEIDVAANGELPVHESDTTLVSFVS